MPNFDFTPKGNPREGFERTPANSKKPLYIIQILDTSGSMSEESVLVGEDGKTTSVPKIDQLNQGVKKVIESLKNFERKGVFYDVYLQLIELNSYGKALFPEFVPIFKNVEEISFKAGGSTCLENVLGTLKRYINVKYMPGYNKAVSVILMSDGEPTDANGFPLSEREYKAMIDEFNAYLQKNDYARNVDLYSIAVGSNAGFDMLKYFSGEERFFTVEQSESIAEKLDFVTRKTLAAHTNSAVPVKVDDDEEELEDGDDEEEYEEDEDEDEDDEEEEADEEEEELSKGLRFKPYSIRFISCLKEKCQSCIPICPVKAITLSRGMIFIDPDKCRGCGLCASICPVQAIYSGDTDSDLDGLLD